MNPSGPLADAAPQFLADLDEFMTLPGLEGFEDMVNDDPIAFFRRRRDILRRWPKQFRALEWDYNGKLAQLESMVEKMTKDNAEVEKAMEALLQSEADEAERKFAAFRQWKAQVEKLLDERPFDPEVQRLKEELDELAKHLPKE